MKRQELKIITALLFVVAASAAGAEEAMLTLTAEEFDANQNFRERSVEILQKPTDPLAPRIVVEKPDVGADVQPPVEVNVIFEPADGATIDMDSLRIRYGWFDITDRVLESMNVSDSGISGKINSMRMGRYTLKLSIADTEKRESKAHIVFEVVDT